MSDMLEVGRPGRVKARGIIRVRRAGEQCSVPGVGSLPRNRGHN